MHVGRRTLLHSVHAAANLPCTLRPLLPCSSPQVGQRQTVQQEEYFCHAFNKDGLVGIAFVDEAYPARAGFCVVSCRWSWWRRGCCWTKSILGLLLLAQ